MIKAELVSGDFEEKTMTFETEGEMILKAGKYKILTDEQLKKHSLNFGDWLMNNCDLSEDSSLWSYEGEDYTNEKLYDFFIEEYTGEKISTDLDRLLKKQENCNHVFEKEGKTPFKSCVKCGLIG
tara:strand:- start:55 stop:429 length:375 start_codon:yes stop_codon:yes gene_type:complete